MAVGIIIGGTFTSIVSSLVEDIINPFLGIFGGMNFDKLHWNIVGDVTLNYGKFLTAVMNFLIRQWIPDEDGLGDSGDMDLWDIYADYINGKREIAEINAEMSGTYYTEEDLK